MGKKPKIRNSKPNHPHPQIFVGESETQPVYISLHILLVINLCKPFEVVGIKVCYILILTHTSEIL